jgi:hypothetical protein
MGTAMPARGKPYKGAEVYGAASYRYGRVEMRMRMARGSGVLSTFFTYKLGSELSGAFWEEIDIEVFGKDNVRSWQSNIITGNPRQTSEQVHTAGSSLADDYHTYVLEWTPEYVAWRVDGVEVRRSTGGQVTSLTNAQTLRFNIWVSDSVAWVGSFDDSVLPVHQFVNWIRYYRYEGGAFVLDWTDEFDDFQASRWAKANWTFDGNLVDFDPANAVVRDGTLVLALTREGQTGFSGTVPVDSGNPGTGGTGGGPGTGGVSSTGGLSGTGGAAIAGGSGGTPASGGGPSAGGAASGTGGAPVASGGTGAIVPGSSDSEGCSCSTPGRTASGSGLTALAWVFGIAFVFGAPHRRRS